MARNRMIKPDFWDDEKLATISKQSRLLYIAMWNFSDDFGVVKGNSKWLKNNIFGYEDDSFEQFDCWLKELQDLKRIIPFCDSNEKYYFLPKFQKHQTINRPSKHQRNPEPPDNINEPSMSPQHILTDEVKLSKDKLSKKEKEAFSPPSQEHINESSILKLSADLENICNELYDSKIFPKAFAFKNTMLKRGKNERAILHTLSRCYLKKDFKKDGGPWAYCEKIIQVENGNFNERDHLKTM